MKVTKKYITIGQLANGYIDKGEGGVFAYGGKLNVRPPYQREFCYDDKKRAEVIRTVLEGCPLGLMYWCVGGKEFECMDGQQRTISICEYVHNGYSVDKLFFKNQPDEVQQTILNTDLLVYLCEGGVKEKLTWFRRINIAGEKLTEQELRNAAYTGAWVMDLKRRFAKRNCDAVRVDKDFQILGGSAIRQDYIETVLDWLADRDGRSIEDYMGGHQDDMDAGVEWSYFTDVRDWVIDLFGEYRKEMKGLEWGKLYNAYRTVGISLDRDAVKADVKRLMEDKDVTRKKGIYEYVLSGKERCLSIRAFEPSMIRSAYEKQNGVCACCGERFDIEEMEADHIVPWSKGGRTVAENCRMLCKECNREKSDK